MNVKEAEEQAKEWIEAQDAGFGMAACYIELLGLARRLATAINDHAETGMCSACYEAFAEAREAGLLEAPE